MRTAQANAAHLASILSSVNKYFRWACSDLFTVVSSSGSRRTMVVIETNSGPSGQKSMPLLRDHEEGGGYKTLIEGTFKSVMLDGLQDIPDGDLAVVYDKNPMEASGYAAVMADVMERPVWLVEFYKARRGDASRARRRRRDSVPNGNAPPPLPL